MNQFNINMDNREHKGNPDRDRINLNENYEVEYWAKKFDITPERLREVVKTAGTAVKDVEKYFNK
jgi:hypothetical protein